MTTQTIVDSSKPVEFLQLSNRSLNALINADICTIDQLIDLARRNCLMPHCIKGLGKKSVLEILEKLEEFGFLQYDEERETRQLHTS